MTKTDAAKLVAIMVAAYPNYDKFKNAEAVQATVNLWAMMFATDDGGLVGLAVKKHIATSKWPPSVAEIRELMLEMTSPDLIPPDMAWAEVATAIRELSAYAERSEYEERLPPLVCRAADAVGWEHLRSLHRDAYVGEKAGMDRLAFLQQYTPMYERERRRAMTPEGIEVKIDRLREQRLAKLPEPEPPREAVIPLTVLPEAIEELRRRLAE